MTDEDTRREGRDLSYEEAREARRLSVLARATEAQNKRRQRAAEAVERLGAGAVFDGSVILTVGEAEKLGRIMAAARDYEQKPWRTSANQALLKELRGE